MLLPKSPWTINISRLSWRKTYTGTMTSDMMGRSISIRFIASGITILYWMFIINTSFTDIKAVSTSELENQARSINSPQLWPKPENPVPTQLENNTNIQIVQNLFEAYGKNDLEGIRQVLAEDVQWHIPGRHPLSGTKNGINEVMNFFEELEKTGFKAEVMILAANDNYVIDAHRGWSNVTNGENVDLNWVLLYQIENNKIKRVINFAGDQPLADEFFTKSYGNSSVSLSP
jgi:ketosteroid isomerase-like protein